MPAGVAPPSDVNVTLAVLALICMEFCNRIVPSDAVPAPVNSVPPVQPLDTPVLYVAVVPLSVTPILYVLLAAGVIKTAPAYLLEYTGYFKEIARLSIANVILMTIGIGAGLLLRLDMIGLLWLYAGALVIASLLYLAAAVRGPVRTTH